MILRGGELVNWPFGFRSSSVVGGFVWCGLVFWGLGVAVVCLVVGAGLVWVPRMALRKFRIAQLRLGWVV